MGKRTEGSSLLHRTRSDPAAFWTAISSIAACVAALFAGWAALETRNAAVEANKATRASVWLQVLGEYASPEMLASMKELRAWQQQRPKGFAETFKNLLKNAGRSDQEEKLANNLDLDRRRVSHFFHKLEALCEGGVLDEEFVEKEWSYSTYTFISDVIIPMEKAKAEALVETQSMTEEERLAGNRMMDAELEFYRRISRRAFFAYTTSAVESKDASAEEFGLPSP